MITFRNFYQRNNLLFMCIFNRKKFIRIARQSVVSRPLRHLFPAAFIVYFAYKSQYLIRHLRHC